MKMLSSIGLLVLLLCASPQAIAQEQELLGVPDNLVAEGMPKIPTALADELHRWTETRGAWLASWHPTQRQMLIGTRFADTIQVHLVKFPEGARTQLTFFKDSIDDVSYQPTRGDYFVISKGSGGNENYQKYRFDLATGAITLLTDGKSRNTGGIWSNAGDQYVYGSTRRNGQDVDLWIMNPADPKTDRMLAQLTGGGWEPMDFSPDDKTVLAKEFVSINEIHLWLIDAASGKRERVTAKTEAETVAYSNAVFSRDGKGLYLITDRDSEFQRLAYLDLATKSHTYLTDTIKWDIQNFALSWDGKIIAFIANEDGLGVLHLLDTATQKERPAPKLPIGQCGGLHWHKNNVDLGLSFTSVKNPADAYSANASTGELTRWTFSETGGINTERFVDPSIVHWKSFDGRSISGWLYTPPPDKFPGKRPVIIDIHGGPEGQVRPAFGAMNNYLVNEMGIALVRPNVRGSTGYGKSFTKLDNGLLREDSYKDIGALLDWIKTRDDLDADRIMVTGGSYGGHMTLATATCYPDRIRCALDIVGPSNLATFLKNTSGYRQDLRRAEYGDERDARMRDFLNRTSPLTNAARITKPLFIVQGANDPRVPASESLQMVETLRKNHIPVWYLLAKDEGHGFDKKKNEDYLFYATILFIREHLLN